jgi:hypothetical protein
MPVSLRRGAGCGAASAVNSWPADHLPELERDLLMSSKKRVAQSSHGYYIDTGEGGDAVSVGLRGVVIESDDAAGR